MKLKVVNESDYNLLGLFMLFENYT